MKIFKRILALALVLVLLSTTAAWADNPYAKYRDGDSQTEATAETTEAPAVDPTETPAVTPTEAPAADPTEEPAEEAASGKSAEFEEPDKSEQLKEFEITYVHAPDGESVQTYTSPDGEVYKELLDSTPVIIAAQRGDYSCIVDARALYYDSRENLFYYGWVETEYLDSGYYSNGDNQVTPLRTELETWSNIENIYSVRSSSYDRDTVGLIGLKSDGTTVSSHSSADGISLSNWGKLESIYSISGTIFGLKEDGGVKIYTSYEGFYPNREFYDDEVWDLMFYDEKYADDIWDLRYADAEKIIFAYDNGGLIVLLSDGTVRMSDELGYVYKAGEGFGKEYAFSENGVWNYIEVSKGGKLTLYTEKNGKLDFDNGKDVTNDDAYAIENILNDVVDIAAKYPDEGFTALKSDGSVVLYGSMAPDSQCYYDDQAFNYDFDGLDELVDMKMGIKDGKLVTVTQDGSFGDDFGEQADPNIYGEWSNIVYAVIGGGTLAAVDSDGNTYGCKFGESPDCGQTDFTGWKNVKSVVLVNDWRMETFATLGITKDGKVLIAGTLPDESDLWGG